MSRDKQFNWTTANFDISPELIEMTRQMPVALLEYSQTLWALQLDTANSLVAEMTRQFRYWLNSAAYGGDTLSQWPNLYQPQMQRFVDITRGWLDVATQASSQMNQLSEQALSASLALAGDKLATYPWHERRKLAQVIPFADRRRVPGQYGAQAGSNQATNARTDVKARRSSGRRGSSS